PCDLVDVVRDSREHAVRLEQFGEQLIAHRGIRRGVGRAAGQRGVDQQLGHAHPVPQREGQQLSLLLRRDAYDVPVLTPAFDTPPALLTSRTRRVLNALAGHDIASLSAQRSDPVHVRGPHVQCAAFSTPRRGSKPIRAPDRIACSVWDSFRGSLTSSDGGGRGYAATRAFSCRLIVDADTVSPYDGDMANQPSVEEAVERARRAQEDRIAAIRTVAQARQS